MKTKRKERKDLSLDKLSEALKNPPTNVYVSVYTEKVVEVKSMPSKDKTTLRQMVIEGFKQINTRLDGIDARLDNLEVRVNRIETRLDRIDARLDYIVKANDLKDLPKKR